ncbi:nucleotidyltransferase family protein [Alkanindiges illinoisensis]|uniref:Nucleotidyltransferase family protein n=2 Tax=Alkanindiges illinoisensis TaxID=197183 RepID=A0A4Y7XEV7_9GAMM|nr:nucleotidyltransferase family protein [Alkanindiges illinoisensis]
MQILQIAADFCRKNHLNDWCLAAGFVRNLVWDHLHNYTDATALNDIDLIYFNSANTLEDIDLKFEQELKQLMDINWSVKNQARMHTRNHDLPYKNIAEAMSYWPEVETAVGVYLSENEIRVVAPFGLKSLFEGTISLNPKRPKPEIFYQRIQQKRWLEKWPELQIRKMIIRRGYKNE